MDAEAYLRLLRAHWIAITVCTLVAIAGAFAWTTWQTPSFEATSTGIVRVEGADDLASLSAADVIAQSKVTSFVDVGRWREVAQRAIDDLDLDRTPESLVQDVTVTNPIDTTTIQVVARAPSAQGAQDLADAWMRALAEQIAEIEQGSGVVLVLGDSAELPTSPASPNVRLALAAGALVGFLLGVGYAVVRHLFDRRIRSSEQVEASLGTAVVGALPRTPSLLKQRRLVGALGAAADVDERLLGEALRTLRTNIEFVDVDHPPRSIVVTSPLPGDGKTTVSANLAVVIASLGHPVVLIDGDLRRPMVASAFGLPEGAGLTDVLAGRVEMDEVAHRLPQHPQLVVLTAGRIPPNPSELLGSERMRDVVARLADQALVLIDAPPLLPVTDAAVLAARADGALVLTSVGRTTMEVLGLALSRLDRVHARVFGVVLNLVPRRGAGAQYYGYQFRGAYGAGADAAVASAGQTPEVAVRPPGQRRGGRRRKSESTLSER